MNIYHVFFEKHREGELLIARELNGVKRFSVHAYEMEPVNSPRIYEGSRSVAELVNSLLNIDGRSLDGRIANAFFCSTNGDQYFVQYYSIPVLVESECNPELAQKSVS